MINILKANELPPGARIMGRQGRALNGLELSSGLVSMIHSLVGEEAAEAAKSDLENEWWSSLHLTFPRAKIEWVEVERGIWLQCLLGNGKTWKFLLNDEEADIRNMKEMGPFATPDDMRDALGLPRIAQFKLPSGEVVTAELPSQHLRSREPKREEILAQIAEVPQMVAKPVMEDMEVVRKEAGEAVDRLLSGTSKELAGTSQGGFVSDFSHRFKPAETAPEELLAEPPKVETAPPPAEPIKSPARAGLKKSVKAGGRK